MSVTLSENQIERIFNALNKKRIKYIDVQHELVDHIATEIESNSIDEKVLNFEEELQKSLSKFPNNLHTLVSAKEKEMNKYWRRKTLEFIITYFKAPKIFFSVGTFLAIYCSTILNGKLVLISAMLLLIPLIIYTLFTFFKSIGVNLKQEKKYLVVRMFMSNTVGMIFIPSCLMNLFTQNIQYEGLLLNWRLALIISAVLFTYLWCHACLTAFPDMLKKELRQKYPYLKLSN